MLNPLSPTLLRLGCVGQTAGRTAFSLVLPSVSQEITSVCVHSHAHIQRHTHTLGTLISGASGHSSSPCSFLNFVLGETSSNLISTCSQILRSPTCTFSSGFRLTLTCWSMTDHNPSCEKDGVFLKSPYFLSQQLADTTPKSTGSLGPSYLDPDLQRSNFGWSIKDSGSNFNYRLSTT